MFMQQISGDARREKIAVDYKRNNDFYDMICTE